MKQHTTLYALPSQKLSLKMKTKSWGEDCVRSIANMGDGMSSNGRTSQARKKINYDLVNSIFDKKDLSYVLDPYGAGVEASQPAQMRDINLIVNKISLLKGEEIARPFNFQVVATNGGAVTAKDKKVQEMLLNIAMNELAKVMGVSLEPQVNPETGEQMPVTFEEVEKYKNYSMKDIRETWCNQILKYLTYKETLPLVFNSGWEHALISAEEVYYIGIVNGQPKVRVCNPLNIRFDRNPDNPNIEDGDWFCEERWMTQGQILDEYGSMMTEEELAKLDSGSIRQGLTNSMQPGFAYDKQSIDAYENGFFGKGGTSSSHYIIRHTTWASWKKIGFLSYPDNNGEMQENIIDDDSFKLSPEMKMQGMTLEWQWVKEYWQGTMIGADIIVGVGPVPNQQRSNDNPHEVKMQYVGSVYNGTNSVQTSVVDLIKPHQYLYNIIWFRLESEIAKAKGKKFVMDMAAIPKSQGIDMEKWINFFDNVGIAFINSHEEGHGSAAGQVSTFNQYQAIDMSISQSIGQYINILGKIESLVDRMIGIGGQREGGSTAHETAHGVGVSQTQSAYITEHLFYRHNDVKRRVLTSLLEAAKLAYPKSKKIHYFTDDVVRKSVEVDMEKLSDSDYDLFVSNSSQDNAIMLKLDNLAQMALSADKVALSDIVKIYRSNSSHEIEKNLVAAEELRQQQAQQSQQSQQQADQAAQQAELQAKAEERAFKAEENRLDRENKLQVATIASMQHDADVDNNGILDAVAQADSFTRHNAQQAKEREANIKHQIEISKLASQVDENAKDRALKRHELEVKKQIEDKKAATALKNRVVGE